MPENPEIVQPLTLLREVADRESERLAAIRRALSHPQFYDGDIGADIRWLLSGYELLRQHAKSHQRDYASLAKKLDDTEREQIQDRRVMRNLEQELIGANEMKAKNEQSAAEGWANYRELKAFVRQIRERFASYRRQSPRHFNAESESRKSIIAVGYDPGDWRAEAVERENKLMDLFLRDLDAITDGRCEGRYPVPQTAPPRDEPFDVTYRCALPKGHEGPHRSEP
jgi:chromosome segregation ATPase